VSKDCIQFAVASLLIGAITSIAVILLTHPVSVTSESKELVIGMGGALTTALGVACHSLFGGNVSPNGQGVTK
jgi:inosine-uridine nucleoside N-ribohydrolase